MKSHLKVLVAVVFLTSISFASSFSNAADSVETFDSGSTNVDFYLGFDGIGLEKSENTFYGDIMLGYGLIDRMSAYLGVNLHANAFFTSESGDIYLGIFGTPVETDHFDLDLFLDIGLGGLGFSEFHVTPSFELNLDTAPDMSSFGLYLRGGVPLYGREDPDGFPDMILFHVESTVGAYYTIATRHQILLEYNMTFRQTPLQDEQVVDVGGVALGYNVILGDTFELINQVYLDIPSGNEVISVGVMIGFTAAMPR